MVRRLFPPRSVTYFTKPTMNARLKLLCILLAVESCLQSISAREVFNPSRPTIVDTAAKVLRLDCSVPRSMMSGWQSLDRLEIEFKPRGCSERVSLAFITPELDSPTAPNLPTMAEVEGHTDCTEHTFDCRLHLLSPFPSNFVDLGVYYCVLVYNKTTGSSESLEFGVNVDQNFVESSQSHPDHIFTATVIDAHKLVLSWNKSEWEGVTEASVVRMIVDNEGQLTERPRSLLRVAGQQSIVYDNVGVLLSRNTPISTRTARTKRSDLDEILDSRSTDMTQTLYVLKDSCQEKCPRNCYVCRYVFSCELNHPRCIGEDAKFCFCHDSFTASAYGTADAQKSQDIPIAPSSGDAGNGWNPARPLAVVLAFFILALIVCLVFCVLHRTGKLCGNQYASEIFCCPGRHAHRRRDGFDSSRSSDRDGRHSSESPGEEGRSFLPPSND